MLMESLQNAGKIETEQPMVYCLITFVTLFLNAVMAVAGNA